jgi:hypothetical protein
MTSAAHATANHAARMLARGARLFLRFLEAVAEARRHRALMEAERFRGRYRHSSTNHDAPPIVR